MAAPLTVKRVLLMDDDADDFLLFEEAIRQIDANGTLELAFIHPGKDIIVTERCQSADILFLDINMPDKDGFERLKEIREAGCGIPVVMYSTASNPTYVQRAYELGAHVYFPKPESFRKLQTSLGVLLSYDWEQPDRVKAQFTLAGAYKTFDLA